LNKTVLIIACLSLIFMVMNHGNTALLF